MLIHLATSTSTNVTDWRLPIVRYQGIPQHALQRPEGTISQCSKSPQIIIDTDFYLVYSQDNSVTNLVDSY